jgi:hypothetical protein
MQILGFVAAYIFPMAAPPAKQKAIRGGILH